MTHFIGNMLAEICEKYVKFTQQFPHCISPSTKAYMGIISVSPPALTL